MFKLITKWATEMLSELKCANKTLVTLEDRQRQMNASIKQIEHSIDVLASCVDDGFNNKPKKAILTKNHKEGAI